MLSEQPLDDAQKILAVDDNAGLLQLVRETLERKGFWVLTAVSGPEALRIIKKSGLPHLAIIDLNMPVMDGFDLCKAIHQFAPLPVIMLTAIDDEQTIVSGLNQYYVEDYIIKPFRPAELAARVRRVLRSVGAFHYTLDPVITVDAHLQVGFPDRTLWVNQKEVSLTPTESRLLYILMQNAGRIVTNNFLLRRLWPDQSANEERLHTHIYRLRRKIEPEREHPRYIISQWGDGYMFPAQKMLDR